MLTALARTALAASALVMTACALDAGGLGATDDEAGASVMTQSPTGGVDASVPSGDGGPRPPPAMLDSGTAGAPTDGAPTDAPVDTATSRPPFDASACNDAGGPCVVVPGGWSLVAFAPTQASSCPAGFSVAPAVDVVEGPDASGACGCGPCTVTQAPSCASGAVAGYNDIRSRGGAGLCGSVDMPSPLSNNPPGACGTDIFQGDYSIYDVQYNAPPPTGGACRSPGVAQAAAVTYKAQERMCTPDTPQAAGCTGDVCRPTLPTGYGACIAAPGAMPCPQGPLGVQHIVGTSATFTCADCGCTATATCSGTLTLYADANCSKGATPIATNVCVSMSGMSSAKNTFQAYEYAGDPPQNVACHAAAAAGAGQAVALANDETLCCAQ
jgi:hypothetical protein